MTIATQHISSIVAAVDGECRVHSHGSSSDHISGRSAGEGRADESTGCLAAYGSDSQGSNCHGSYIAECFSFVSVAMKNHCCVKVKQLLLVALWYLVVIVASIDMKLWLIMLG